MEKTNLKTIKKLISQNGGITLDNNLNIKTFEEGYIVSQATGGVNVGKLRKITKKLLMAIAKTNDNACIGVYKRQDNGTYDIDINNVVDSLGSALILGKMNNQEAIYDIKNDTTILVK